MGIRWNHEPPENGSCQFCGRLLEPQGLVFQGMVLIWNPILPRCDCKQAQAYWERCDREEEAKKTAAEEEARRKAMREDVFHWWMEDGILPGQLNFDDLAELTEDD